VVSSCLHPSNEEHNRIPPILRKVKEAAEAQDDVAAMQRKEVEVLAKLERNRTRMFGVGDTGGEGEGEGGGEEGAYDGGYDERKNAMPVGAASLESATTAAATAAGDKSFKEEKREKREKRNGARGSKYDINASLIHIKDSHGEGEGNKEERRESRRRKKGSFSRSNPFVCTDPRAVLMEVEDEEDLLGLGEGVQGGGGEDSFPFICDASPTLPAPAINKDRGGVTDKDSVSNSSRGRDNNRDKDREDNGDKDHREDEGSPTLGNSSARLGKKRKLTAKEMAEYREGSGMSGKAIRAQAGFDRALNRGRTGVRGDEGGEVLIDLATENTFNTGEGEGGMKGEGDGGGEGGEEEEVEMDFDDSTSGVVVKTDSAGPVPTPSFVPAPTPAPVPVPVPVSHQGELTEQRCLYLTVCRPYVAHYIPHPLSLCL
jgi:hypothetical protein